MSTDFPLIFHTWRQLCYKVVHKVVTRFVYKVVARLLQSCYHVNCILVTIGCNKVVVQSCQPCYKVVTTLCFLYGNPLTATWRYCSMTSSVWLNIWGIMHGYEFFPCTILSPEVVKNALKFGILIPNTYFSKENGYFTSVLAPPSHALISDGCPKLKFSFECPYPWTIMHSTIEYSNSFLVIFFFFQN